MAAVFVFGVLASVTFYCWLSSSWTVLLFFSSGCWFCFFGFLLSYAPVIVGVFWF